MFDVLQLQKELAAAAAAPGLETKVGKLLGDFARPYVDEVYTDTIGNVICHKKGPGKKIAFPAHMDPIAFMALYIEESGAIRYAPMGGHQPMNLQSTPVVFESGAYGTIMPDAKAKAGTAPLSSLNHSNFFIDIGAASREEALRYVQIGETAKFAAKTVKIGEDTIMTRYSDDLVCCITLLLAMQYLHENRIAHQNDLYFIFSVQEEVGTRGAATAAYHLQPDMCIALDVTPTSETPNTPKAIQTAFRVGDGPTIKVKDRSLLCNPQVIAHLRAAAEEHQIPWQDEVLLAGGTDAGAMQRSRGGVPAGCLSIPIRNVHSPCEMYRISDVQNGGKLIAWAAARDIAY